VGIIDAAAVVGMAAMATPALAVAVPPVASTVASQAMQTGTEMLYVGAAAANFLSGGELSARAPGAFNVITKVAHNTMLASTIRDNISTGPSVSGAITELAGSLNKAPSGKAVPNTSVNNYDRVQSS